MVLSKILLISNSLETSAKIIEISPERVCFWVELASRANSPENVIDVSSSGSIETSSKVALRAE